MKAPAAAVTTARRVGRIMDLIPSKHGHFRLESGHHAEFTLDLRRRRSARRGIRPNIPARACCLRIRFGRGATSASPPIWARLVAQAASDVIVRPEFASQLLTIDSQFADEYRWPAARPPLHAAPDAGVL